MLRSLGCRYVGLGSFPKSNTPYIAPYEPRFVYEYPPGNSLTRSLSGAILFGDLRVLAHKIVFLLEDSQKD